MKKSLHILFILAYLLPTVGFTVAYHFCGGTLVSTSLVISEEIKEPVDCCADEPEDDPCCTDHVVTYKLDDSHFASAKISLDNIASDFSLIPSEVILQNHFDESHFINTTLSHSPPGNPVYIVNRTLLI